MQQVVDQLSIGTRVRVRTPSDPNTDQTGTITGVLADDPRWHLVRFSDGSEHAYGDWELSDEQ